MCITWGLLSKYKSELYGFSIIWIMLFHGLEIKKTDLGKSLKFLQDFIEHGNCGVEVFLFLSGICLYYSLTRCNDIIMFYKKRMSRVILPLIIIDGLYWMYLYILKDCDILRFLSNITLASFWVGYFWAGQERLVWFVALIVPLYLLYPFIYRYILNEDNKKSLIKIVFLCLAIYFICILLNHFYHKWYMSVEIALTRIPVFLLGCYLGKFVYENKEIDKRILLVSLFFVIYGLGYFYFHQYSLVKAYRSVYLFVGPSIAIWFCIVLEILSNKTINKTLCILGGLSLELYLSQNVLRKIFLKSSLYGMNYQSNFWKYVLVCCLGAFFISKLVDYINTKFGKMFINKL